MRRAWWSGVPLGRLFGFPVVLSPSWLVLAVALTVGYGRLLDREGPVAYVWGAGLVACLAGSVLLHELGHAVACRWVGIGVRSVTLELLGGYTDMDRDAPGPGVEAVVSLAGPAVSGLLGLLAAGAAALVPPHVAGHEVAVQLAAANLVIAAFNILPGLPLDGGRALLAAVWAWTGDQYRGIRVAGRAGWVVAGGCLAAAVVVAVQGRGAVPGPGHLIAVLALVLVALSVGHGAGEAVRLGRLGARLPLLSAVALARPVFRVPTGTPLDEAHRRADEAGAGGATLGVADADGAVVALVNAALDAAVPAERRGRVPVDAVARSLSGRVLHPDLRGADVLRAVGADPSGDYLVAAGEDVVGVLRGADVARLLTSRESAR
jgi:Zn-dependent protease